MIDTLASVIGWTLVHSLWQGAAVALAAGVLLAIVPRGAVRVRYAILCGALFAHIGAPIVTAAVIAPRVAAEPGYVVRLTNNGTSVVVLPGSGNGSADGPGTTTVVSTGATSSISSVMDLVARARLERFLPIVVLAWCLGVAVGAARSIGGWLVLRRIVNRSRPATDAIAARVRGIARAMGIHRRVDVLASSDVSGPFTTGWLRPVIVLPLSMLSGLDPVHVNAIIAHELAHVRRWDYFVAIAQAVATTVLFHHPVTWWLDRRLRVEREYCCDDLAVAASQDRVGYVRALAELESLRLGLPSLALAATDGSLHDRVARLLAGRSSSAPAAWAPAATVLAVVFAATVMQASVLPTNAAEVSVTNTKIVVPGEVRVVENVVQRISVIPHPDPSAPFDARWTWALEQARTRSADSDVVIGWRVRTGLGEGSVIISSSDRSSNARDGQVVGDLIGADDRDRDGATILLTWSGGANGQLTAVRLRDLRSKLALRGRSLLWLHGADDASSIARLEQLMSGSPVELRKELAAALTLHGDTPRMLRAVTRVVDTDRDANVRGEAVSWLGNRADDAGVTALLRRMIDDDDAHVRDEAVSALGGTRGGQATLLGVITSSKHADVRGEAVQRLSGGGDDVIPMLLKVAFDDPNADVQAEAVDAIKETTGGVATRALRDIAQRHPDRRLRSEARDALDERGIR
jgi:beta-lactamase regulating signal transducer with metallopeptidase domain